MLRKKVRDLLPLHTPVVSGPRPALMRLSDARLLAACNAPSRGDRIRQNMKNGRLINGNGRAYELRRRAADPTSVINWDTEVDVEPYDVDDSMFID